MSAAPAVAQRRHRRRDGDCRAIGRRGPEQARGGCAGHPRRAGGCGHMSLLMLRAAILGQDGVIVDPPTPARMSLIWALDATRRPAGYTLSDASVPPG